MTDTLQTDESPLQGRAKQYQCARNAAGFTALMCLFYVGRAFPLWFADWHRFIPDVVFVLSVISLWTLVGWWCGKAKHPLRWFSLALLAMFLFNIAVKSA